MEKHWTIRDEEEDIVHHELIGRGGYGEVHKVSCVMASADTLKLYDSKQQLAFARKLIRPFATVSKADIENEVRALNKLCKSQHPSIVQILQCGPLKDGGAFYFIDMELCDFTLHQYMQGQDIEGIDNWNTIRQQDSAIERGYDILLHITNGLLYIHCLREVHRDLILFQNGNWKIADFGLTSEATSNRLVTSRSSRGKPCYRAPELLRETNAGYNNKADIWSLGCIAYELFTGTKAFSDDFDVVRYAESKRKAKNFSGLDVFGKEYVGDLLGIKPESRPSAKQLLRRGFKIQKPFISAPAHTPSRKRRSILQDLPAPPQLPVFMNTLDWAISKHHTEMIVALSLAGLDPWTHNEGKFFAALVASNTYAEIVKQLLRENGCSAVYTLLRSARGNGYAAVVHSLLDQILAEKKLSQLSVFDHAKVVKLLAQAGAVTKESGIVEICKTVYQTTSYEIASTLQKLLPPELAPRGPDWFACINDMESRPRPLDVSHLHTIVLSTMIICMRFSPDGQYIALGSSLGTLIFNAKTMVKIAEWNYDCTVANGPIGACSAVCFSPDCQYLASGHDYTGKLYLWHIAEKRPYLRFSGHTSQTIRHIDISRDGTLLVSGGDGKSVRLWGMNSGQQLFQWDLVSFFTGSESFAIRTLTAVGFSADGKYVWALHQGRQISWPIDSEVPPPSPQNSPGTKLGDAPDNLFSLSGLLTYGTRRQYNPPSYFGATDSRVSEISIVARSSGGCLAVGGISGLVQLWSLRDGKPKILIRAKGMVNALAIGESKTCTMLATGDSLKLRIWSFDLGR